MLRPAFLISLRGSAGFVVFIVLSFVRSFQPHINVAPVRFQVAAVSDETRDLGEILRHRIAGHLDAGGIEPGMGVERLFLALRRRRNA